MRQLVVIAHNIRSTYNVGALLRTADGIGVQKVYLTGYTPYPLKPQDARLPHIAKKLNDSIRKTALGADKTVAWEQSDDVFTILSRLKQAGFTVCALEQTDDALDITKYQSPEKCALVLGSEVTGVATEILTVTDLSLFIPMYGYKESFNVVQAAAMALYQLRFY